MGSIIQGICLPSGFDLRMEKSSGWWMRRPQAGYKNMEAKSMELAMIGLGKMGLNMAARLVRGGHRVVGYARTAESVQKAIENGAEGAHSLEETVSKLRAPRSVWVMVPAGQATDETIEKLSN